MKKTILLMVLALGMCSIGTMAQRKQSREKQTEKNGYQWYKIFSYFLDASYNFRDEKYGAEDINGNTLIPLSRGYDFIGFFPKDNTVGYFYFYVERNGKAGACDITGKEIIAPNKYDFVCFLEEEDHVGYYKVKINGVEGACDITGREVIPCRYKELIYSPSDCFKYMNSSGDWITLNVKLDSQGRAYQGGVVSSTSSSSNIVSSSGTSSSYNDAIVFDLKGRVKSCQIVESHAPMCISDLNQNGTLAFSADGKFIPENSSTKIERDGSGRITKISAEFDRWNFSYNSKGQVDKFSFIATVIFFSTSEEAYFTYNTKGMVSKIDLAENNMVGLNLSDLLSDPNHKVYTYSYTRFDAQGNWTERTVTHNGETQTEKRVITYY